MFVSANETVEVTHGDMVVEIYARINLRRDALIKDEFVRLGAASTRAYEYALAKHMIKGWRGGVFDEHPFNLRTFENLDPNNADWKALLGKLTARINELNRPKTEPVPPELGDADPN